MELLTRFLPIPDQSFFLFGPRGTGKTTWLRQQLPDAYFVDLLLPDVYRRLRARPERLIQMVAGERQATTVVIDEVQRIPELLNVVHHLIEEPDRRRFVLTGSSARKLRRGGVDLLAGRAVQRGMHPFMASELPDFRLDRALELGMLPVVLSSDLSADTLSAYANLYLEEEVQVEGWARNIGDFARFLEVISFSHAQVLNVANVARECETGRKTVDGYIKVLEDLLLALRLPVFNRRARRKPSTHPKLFLFDTGVYRSLRPQGTLDRPEEIAGPALEGLVAQHLRAWLDYSRCRSDLYFWRTRAGVEVDFVVYGEGGFWAIEVKSSDRVRSQDLRALRTFLSDYPESEAILLYRGDERLRIDEIWCLPIEDFLRRLHPSRGLTG